MVSPYGNQNYMIQNGTRVIRNDGEMNMSSHQLTSRLSPNLVCNLPYQIKLLPLFLLIQRIPTLMSTEPALRAHGNPLERLLLSLALTLGDPIRGAQYTLLHLLLVLQLGQLCADYSNDDILVRWEVLKGLKTSSALGVVLEVEGVDVEVAEELLGDDVVLALGEVAAADKVASAEVDARVHVGGQLGEAVVVELDVGVQKVIDGADVVSVSGPAVAELLAAEVWDNVSDGVL